MIAIVFLIPFADQRRGLAEIVDSTRQHRAESGIDGRLYNGIRRQIHVKVCRDAAGQIFQISELGQMINILLGQLGFHREHLFVEPVLQRQIIRIRTQERHRRVGVCVFKAGQNEIAADIALDIPMQVRRFFLADIDDFVVLNPDFAPNWFKSVRHRQNTGVVQSCVHACSSSGAPKGMPACFLSNTACRLSVYGGRQMPYSVTMPEISV